MKHPLYIAAALLMPALVIFSCSEDKFNEADFVATISSISLTINGSTIMEYDSSLHQLAWNEESLEFRMMDDSLSDYFVVNLASLPQKMGDVVSASLTYTTYTSIKTISNSFTASKIQSASGGEMVWLWEESSKTGVIIQELN